MMVQKAVLLVFLCCANALGANAQDYPVKPIRFVSSAVGGPVDGVGRFLANGLTERLKQQVISDGRSGANGIIGTDIVAKSNPDGYTLLMTTGSFAINPGIYKKLPYDAMRDFVPVSLAAESGGLVLVAHPSVQPRTIRELIEYDRARPGQLTYGSGGIGNTLHMAGELFNIIAKTKLSHVPYKGSAPALTDVLGGHIALMFPSTVIATPHVKSGRLRALGFTGPTRSKVLPDVPTIDESGLKGFDVTGWYGLFAPTGTPSRIISLLQTHIHAVVHAPQGRDQLDAWGLTPVGSTPAAFGEFIRREMEKYARIASEANIPKQ
jgi:hypothetical protein